MRRLVLLAAAALVATGAAPVAGAQTGGGGAPAKTPSKVASIVEQLVAAASSSSGPGVPSPGVAAESPAAADALLKVDRSGRVELTFHAARPTGAAEAADLARLGATGIRSLPQSAVLPRAGMIQAWLPTGQVAAAARLAWVVAVTPPDYGAVDPHPANGVVSQGVALHAADLARAAGVTGAGVTVGAISDGVTSLAASQALNELPAVTVLNVGAGDEGTAMLEIVHDMAPGAALLFDTQAGVVGHANALNNLVANGANVITEDLAFDAQPAFQKGLLATTGDNIAAAGVSVHSSAGNRGQNHAARVPANGTGAGPDGAAGPFALCPYNPTNVVDVDPGPGTAFDAVIGANGASFTLQWSEPRAIFPTAGAGGFTDLDLFIMNAGLTQCLGSSIGLQGNGSGDTIEQVAIGAALAGTAVKIVVNRFGAVGAQGVPLIDLRWRGAAPTDVPTRAGSLNPDSNYTGQATSAAAVFQGSGAIEGFSSGGPVQLLSTTVCPVAYPCAGSSVAGPPQVTAPGPTWAGIDGVAVSGVGGFGSPFFGTSAAAPHTAACDALVRQVLGAASPVAPVTAALVSTATDMAPPGPDNVSGAGLLNCAAAAGLRDFGDAPDSYGTLLASNGARHIVVPGAPVLGATVDVEANGFPGAALTGDDSNATDDEDGVTIPSLIAGVPNTVTVTASAAGGRLDAFFDFNGDGDFTDPGEKVASSLALAAGANSVSFTVPATAVSGPVRARFRLSTAGGLGPTGQAADGEVEDHLGTIISLEAFCAAPPPPGAIVGDAGHNTLVGTAGDDVIFGLAGNDFLDGGGGNDILCGGEGNDQLFGGDGNDGLVGGPGNDQLEGGAGNDSLFGGPGYDRLDGNAGTNFNDGGTENDFCANPGAGSPNCFP